MIYNTSPKSKGIIFWYSTDKKVISFGCKDEDLKMNRVDNNVSLQIPINNYFSSEFEFEFRDPKEADGFRDRLVE